MRVSDVDIKQVLWGLSFDTNPDTRAACENYINAILGDPHHIQENVALLVSLTADKKIAPNVLIILKKFVKTFKHLDELQASQLLNSAFAGLQATIVPSEAALFVDFLLEFLDQIFPSTHAIPSTFIGTMLFNLQAALGNGMKGTAPISETLVPLLFFSEYLRWLSSITVSRNKLHEEVRECFRPIFLQLGKLLDARVLDWVANHAQNKKVLGLVIKVQTRLTEIYKHFMFLLPSYESIFVPLFRGLKNPGELPEIHHFALTKVSKCFHKLYLMLAMNPEFCGALLANYFEVYLAPYDESGLVGSPQKASIFFLNLRVLVSLVEDFGNHGDFSMVIGSKDGTKMTFEKALAGGFPNLLPALVRAQRVLMAEELRTFMVEDPPINEYVDNRSLDSNQSPRLCGDKLASVLLDFYSKQMETEFETFLANYLAQLKQQMASDASWFRNPEMYYHLSIIQSNLFLITNQADITFIPRAIMQLPGAHLNYFLATFLHAYFVEWGTPADLLETGVAYCQALHPHVASDCLRLILVHILIVIAYKNAEPEAESAVVLPNIDFRLIFESFFRLLGKCTGENTHLLSHLLSFLAEILKLFSLDAAFADTVINLFTSIIQLEGAENEVELVQRTADLFSQVVISLPKPAVTLTIFEKCYAYLNLVYGKFKAGHHPCYLANFAKLFIFFLAKLETLLDLFIEQVLAGAIKVEVAQNFCLHILVSIELVCTDLFSHYAENEMHSETILTLFAIANAQTKIYVIVNWGRLPMQTTPGSTAFYIQIESEDQRFVFEEEIANKSKIGIKVGQDPGQTAFAQFTLNVLAKQTNLALETQNVDLLVGVLNVLEFFSICFPFFVEEICTIALDAFDQLKKEHLQSFAREEAHIFTSLTRIVARIFMCCPRSLTTQKLKTYARLVDFLREVNVVGGKFQEILSHGIFIAEYLQGIADKRSDDFLTLFASLNLKEGGNSDDALKCLMCVNVLELIVKSFHPSIAEQEDMIWENVVHHIGSLEEMDALKAFWESDRTSQVEMLFREKTILRESVFKQIVRFACHLLVERQLLSKDHPIFRLF